MEVHLKKRWPYYLSGVIIFIIILYEAQGNDGDFKIFISASRDLLLGNNIYKIQYNNWYHYYYDILFALILVPFTYLPLYVVKIIWLILNVFFVYRIWQILLGWLPLSLLEKNSRRWLFILSFIFILSFLRDNFYHAQVTIFILYLTLEGLYLINTNRRIAGSMLLAFGIDMKLLPLVMIPYLIYKKDWKSTLYILGFVVIFLSLPIAFIGYDFNKFLLLERWQLINPMNHEQILDTAERSFHSLTTLLSTLLVKDCGDMQVLPLKRNIADISIESLNLVINIVRAFFVLLTLYFLRKKPFVPTTNNLQRLYEISYLCLIIPLIFPHQQHYAFFFIFPASTYLLFYIISQFFNKKHARSSRNFKVKKIVIVVLMSIAYFLTNGHFILGEFNRFYDHYKTLTYGVLLLIIILAVCTPERIIKEDSL